MAAFRDLINSDKPVLIDFFAEWCGPCKTLSPLIKQVKEEFGDQLKVLKIDVDKNPSLAESLGIQGVPTMMIYQKGQLKWRQSGVLPAQAIAAEVQKHI